MDYRARQNLRVGARSASARARGSEPPEKNAKNEQYYVLNELIISLMRKGVLTDAEGKAMLEKLLR